MARIPYIRTHNIEDFTWTNNTGVAEISSLRTHSGDQIHSLVYDDACDVGFEVIGKNKTVLFTWVRYERTNDGEIVADVYVSHDEPGKFGKYKIHILND